MLLVHISYLFNCGDNNRGRQRHTNDSALIILNNTRSVFVMCSFSSIFCERMIFQLKEFRQPVPVGSQFSHSLLQSLFFDRFHVNLENTHVDTCFIIVLCNISSRNNNKTNDRKDLLNIDVVSFRKTNTYRFRNIFITMILLPQLYIYIRNISRLLD